jgi:hypothetical protein
MMPTMEVYVVEEPWLVRSLRSLLRSVLMVATLAGLMTLPAGGAWLFAELQHVKTDAKDLKVALAELRVIPPAIDRLASEAAALRASLSNQSLVIGQIVEKQDKVRALADDVTKLQDHLRARIQTIETRLGPLARIERVGNTDGLEALACANKAATCSPSGR